jgi:Flp pilus assembly protein CpaB
MLLGVVLALAAGVLVIYIVSQATATVGQTEQLVVATQDIAPGTVFGSESDINKYFAVKSYPASLVPAGAYVFTTQDDLDVHLLKEVVVTEIFPGDVLLTGDKRVANPATSNAGSLLNVNPAYLQSHANYVLFPLKLDTTGDTGNSRPFVVAGDYVAILATECFNGTCATQTTLNHVYVYATFTNAIVVAVSQQDALKLKYLDETGKLTLALLQSNDNGNSTVAVNASTIAQEFGF